MTSNQTNHRDDAWLAVQYLLGELPGDERADFEQRLVEDSALCQHVADAAVLVATTRVAVAVEPLAIPPNGPPRHLAGRRHLAALAVTAVALCLVLAVLPREDRSSARPGSESGAAAKLVSFWRGHDSNQSADGDELAIDDHPEWANDQVPSWMIAAVSLEHRKRAPGDLSDEKEWEEN